MSAKNSQRILRNLTWLGGSFVLAVVVLVVAKIQADPIEETNFRNVPIQITLDDDYIITNDPSRAARVFIRAPQSITRLLVSDDVTVHADLSGLGEGTHTVPLTVTVARNSPANTDTQPAQITVRLEPLEAQLKPVRIDAGALPPNLMLEMTNQSIRQATVRGALAQLNEVVEVVGRLENGNETGTFERNLNLRALDADGNTVEDVTIEPQVVSVDVEISQREDTREVAVRPVILFDTLDDNFEFRNLNDWTPRSVIINGSPEALAALGNTVDTEPISLEGRTGDFSTSVPLALPDAEFVILSGDRNVRVEIAIREQEITLPLENIAINLIGLPENYTAIITPETISVVLNGPISLLEGVTADNVQAVIDLNGIAAGTHDIAPRISVNGEILGPFNVTVLPQRVTIVLNAPTPEATVEAAGATPTPVSN